MNLQGNLNLLKMNKACIVSIQGNQERVTGVFIPVAYNDIYLGRDESGKVTSALMGVSVLERREPSDDGKTHYVKPNVGKSFREQHPQEAEALAKTYLGNMKPLTFDTAQRQAIESAQPVQADNVVDLPF